MVPSRISSGESFHQKGCSQRKNDAQHCRPYYQEGDIGVALDDAAVSGQCGAIGLLPAIPVRGR